MIAAFRAVLLCGCLPQKKVDFARDIVSRVMKLQSKDNNTLTHNEITVSLV